MKVKSYKELEVWQLAMELVEDVYAVARKLPVSERFALSDQLRRAVVSIPSNIAEGCGRNSTRDLLHFLSVARGSLCEVETQLELAMRMWQVPITDLNEKIVRVGMMINALSTKLKTRLSNSPARAPSSFAKVAEDKRTTTHAPRPTNHEPRTTTND